MDTEKTVTITGWQAEWVERTLPLLRTASATVIYVFAGAALIVGIRTLLCQRRCRQELENEPSKRTAIFAGYRKEMVTANRQQFKISFLFSGLAFLIWSVDAIIGGLAIYKDSSSLGNNTANFWLEFALQMVSIFAMLVFFMAAVPMAQIVGFSFWMQHRYKIVANGSEDTMAAIASEATILSTHFMQLWSLAFFTLVAFWSPYTNHCVIRAILLQSVVGSVQAWSHMSFALNWRPEAARNAELMEALSARAVATQYCKQVKAIYVEKSDHSVLPQHEQLLAKDTPNYGSH